jgi:hypothetical protein
MSSGNFFIASDSPEFKENVELLLSHGAANLRSLEPIEYVKQCRRLWKKAKTDKFYSRKILIDEIFSGDSADFYSVAFAEIHVETDATGTQWKTPKDYLTKRKPLGPYRREVIFVYPTGALRPEADQPETSIQLIALFDVIGFESKLEQLTSELGSKRGLERMHMNYQELIHKTFVPSVAANKYSIAEGMFAGDLRKGYLKLPINYAYFSDTLLMWAPFHNAFVGTFLDRCSSFFCNALKSGLPLRGAISVGDVILHNKTNTYLGKPFIEAARLEKAQETLGVALCNSVRSISFPPDRVMKYEPPIKPLKPTEKTPLSGLVLDWPRFWSDFLSGSPVDKLRELRVSDFAKYYDNAIAFVHHSESNRDWFIKELELQIGPFKKAKPV